MHKYNCLFRPMFTCQQLQPGMFTNPGTECFLVFRIYKLWRPTDNTYSCDNLYSFFTPCQFLNTCNRRKKLRHVLTSLVVTWGTANKHWQNQRGQTYRQFSLDPQPTSATHLPVVTPPGCRSSHCCCLPWGPDVWHAPKPIHPLCMSKNANQLERPSNDPLSSPTSPLKWL